jgi:tRNA threonylcarbamoyladenosine biosynthesis protein TsaE
MNNGNSEILHIKSKADMTALAHKLASESKTGDVFLFKGSLGAGKTFFAKAFIDYFLKSRQEIPSPSFNILKTYNTTKGIIYHFDLYRIKKEEELEELGIEEAMSNGICLIEWPELIYELLNKNYYEIEITIEPSKNNKESRIVKINKF